MGDGSARLPPARRRRRRRRRRLGERSPVSLGVRLTRGRRCQTHGGRNEDSVGADDAGDVRLRFSGLRIPTSL